MVTVSAFMVPIVHFCKCLADAMFYLWIAYVIFNRLLASFGITPYITIRVVKAWQKLRKFLCDERIRQSKRRHKKNRH